MAALRVGIVGAGAWARMVHIPAALTCDRVQLVGILARSQPVGLPDEVAAQVNPPGFWDLVDVVVFAVPPEVQAVLAARAIAAGRHVVLEKPVALTTEAAYDLAVAADQRGVHAITFFPHRLDPEVSQWATAQRDRGGWVLGHAESFSSVLVDAGNPFHSGWRTRVGALWDLGPHAVAQLCAVLGSVERVAAAHGRGDVGVVRLHHERGAVSTIALGADFPPPAPAGSGTVFIGDAGRVVQPPIADWTATAQNAARVALTHLADQVEGRTGPHASDLWFGAHVTAVLDAAGHAMASGREVVLPARV